jgi:hypothetical protein
VAKLISRGSKSLTVVAVASAFVGASVASSAESGQRVITVLSKTASTDALRDRPPKGASKGDVTVGSSVLRNAVAQFGKAKGAVVGRDRWRSEAESANVAAFRVTATLPGGTISCRGRVDFRRARLILRVVAATGVFARASGTCEATRAPKNPYGADSLNAYKLAIPR